MEINPNIRYFVFRHYTWIAISVCFVVLLYLAIGRRETDWRITTTVLGTLLSSVYFVQKQRLEELKLFTELFRDFNRRYDGMNERLNRLMGSQDGPLNANDKDCLYDYFNLCGEEYLYYRTGYIIPAAWEAWKKGMEAYRASDSRVRKGWDEELMSGCYYGLSF